MADVYYRGVGVEKDYATAAAYVQKAAEEGRIAALVSLAAMYARGEGVPRDVVKAEELCRRAIEVDSSYAPAYRNMAVLLKERAKDDKSRAEVEHYLLCAAELNDVDCMVELAREYSSDAGLIRRNTPSAIRWCEASLKEYPESPELNCLLADNLCASPQCCKSRAFIHYSRAAALGEDRAVYKLGRAWEEGWAYEKGKRQPASRDNAAQFYAQAIELGCAEAGAALIRMADLGHTGVEISLSDWLNLLKHASDAGVKGCAAKLAAYYHPECGSQPNADISARWMKVAVERDATPVESVIELSD